MCSYGLFGKASTESSTPSSSESAAQTGALVTKRTTKRIEITTFRPDTNFILLPPKDPTRALLPDASIEYF